MRKLKSHQESPVKGAVPLIEITASEEPGQCLGMWDRGIEGQAGFKGSGLFDFARLSIAASPSPATTWTRFAKSLVYDTTSFNQILSKPLDINRNFLVFNPSNGKIGAPPSVHPEPHVTLNAYVLNCKIDF